MRAAFLFALPWILLPLALLLRLVGSRFLRDYPATPPRNAPLVSVIIPARNEAENIAACVESVLASTWPSLEVIVVDDHSTDGTGDIVRAIAARDARLRVVDAPPLPAGWFGKQWACQNGATAARGDWLLFTDADTRHHPELLARAMSWQHARQAEVVTVGGKQEVLTLGERLVTPQLFMILLLRVGSTEHIARARRAEDSITNGQWTLYARQLYERVGGHAAVKHNVAEDLLLGQAVWRAGARVHLAVALEFFTTRMYVGLREVVDGWTKNVYAGGRYALPAGTPAWFLVVLMFGPVLILLAPVVLAPLGMLGLVPATAGLGGAIAYAALTLWMAGFCRVDGIPIWVAPLWPAGTVIVGWIFARATRRGNRVEWKGRAYDSK
ncbi:MAG: glycosyltransferase [Gemmatimonadetes bacterium]|nr:glycosyltransferase [Gemmatimonadota bacterium]